MRTKSFLSMVALTAVVVTYGLNDAHAGGIPGILIPPGLPGSSVNVHVNGYLPAPPGVTVLIDSGRPYYVERERRVYIERERPVYVEREQHGKHYKKYKKHHEDNGRKHGHDKHDRHDD